MQKSAIDSGRCSPGSPHKAGMTLLAVVVMALFSCAAYAAPAKSPLGGKHNNKTPIEVTSDSLEVMQQENKAIFTGHVVAIQGDVRLTSDKMTVYYASAEEKKADKQNAPAKKTAKDGDNPQGAIKKIDADGNVFLATPEETASGATGTYDVEHQEIHLNNHVTLTRGKNILKGDKLVYNFATGRSVVSSGGDEAKAGAGKGRVHALFVPENDKDKTKNNQ